MSLENKIYLGDGTYVEFIGFEFILTTENGISVTNQIALEPIMLKKLNEFVEIKLKKLKLYGDEK